MSLETDLGGSVDIIERVVTPTTKARLGSVWFSFEHNAAVTEVSLGNTVGGEFVTLISELWVFTGPDFVAEMTAPSVGNTSVQVIRNVVVKILKFIQNNPGKKQELLDNGELVIMQGSFDQIIPLSIMEHVVQ